MIPNLTISPLKIYGPIVVQPFGVMVSIALGVGYLLARRRIRHTGLDQSVLQGSMIWMLIPAWVAAHWLSEILYFPRQTLAHPIVLLEFWGGLSSFGGFVGGTAGALIYLRRKKVPLVQYVDAFMFGLVPAWIFGRLGCTIIFDHPGRPTNFFLGMVDNLGVVRHNLGFYEMLLAVLLSIILYAVRNVRPFNGFHTALILILYAPVRFMLDSLRIADRTYWGFTPGQYFSVVMLTFGVGLAIHGVMKRHPNR